MGEQTRNLLAQLLYTLSPARWATSPHRRTRTRSLSDREPLCQSVSTFSNSSTPTGYSLDSYCTSKRKEEILKGDSTPIEDISTTKQQQKIRKPVRDDRPPNFKLQKAAGKNKEHSFSSFSSRDSPLGHGDDDASQGNQTAEPTAGYA